MRNPRPKRAKRAKNLDNTPRSSDTGWRFRSRLTAPFRMPASRPALLSFLLAALWPAASLADFRLCNNTASRISVAFAYSEKQVWVSEGWWNLKPAACETLLRGPLAAEFYYVYGMDERGGEWKGKAFMCSRDREFKIDGRDDCFVRGFDRTGFFEVDTGKDAKNWTVELTDPAKP